MDWALDIISINCSLDYLIYLIYIKKIIFVIVKKTITIKCYLFAALSSAVWMWAPHSAGNPRPRGPLTTAMVYRPLRVLGTKETKQLLLSQWLQLLVSVTKRSLVINSCTLAEHSTHVLDCQSSLGLEYQQKYYPLPQINVKNAALIFSAIKY